MARRRVPRRALSSQRRFSVSVMEVVRFCSSACISRNRFVPPPAWRLRLGLDCLAPKSPMGVPIFSVLSSFSIAVILLTKPALFSSNALISPNIAFLLPTSRSRVCPSVSLISASSSMVFIIPLLDALSPTGPLGLGCRTGTTIAPSLLLLAFVDVYADVVEPATETVLAVVGVRGPDLLLLLLLLPSSPDPAPNPRSM